MSYYRILVLLISSILFISCAEDKEPSIPIEPDIQYILNDFCDSNPYKDSPKIHELHIDKENDSVFMTFSNPADSLDVWIRSKEISALSPTPGRILEYRSHVFLIRDFYKNDKYFEFDELLSTMDDLGLVKRFYGEDLLNIDVDGKGTIIGEVYGIESPACEFIVKYAAKIAQIENFDKRIVECGCR